MVSSSDPYIIAVSYNEVEVRGRNHCKPRLSEVLTAKKPDGGFSPGTERRKETWIANRCSSLAGQLLVHLRCCFKQNVSFGWTVPLLPHSGSQKKKKEIGCLDETCPNAWSATACACVKGSNVSNNYLMTWQVLLYYGFPIKYLKLNSDLAKNIKFGCYPSPP